MASDAELPKLLLSTREVARALGVSERFVKGLIHTGSLRSLRVGRLRRVHADDLRDWIERQASRRPAHWPRDTPLIPPRDRVTARRGFEHPPVSAPLACRWPTHAPIQPADPGTRQAWSAREPRGLQRTPLVSARRLHVSDKRSAQRCRAPSRMEPGSSRRSVRRPETDDPWSPQSARSPPESAHSSPSAGRFPRVGASAQLGPLDMAEPGRCIR